MLMKQRIVQLVAQAVEEAQRQGNLPAGPIPAIEVEHPQNAEHGDFATSLPLRLARVGTLRVKVASPEHLVLMSLEAFRPRDRERIHLLFSVVDMDNVDRLLQRFDDGKGTLAERLQSLL